MKLLFLKSTCANPLTIRTQHISHDYTIKTAQWNCIETCSSVFYKSHFQQFKITFHFKSDFIAFGFFWGGAMAILDFRFHVSIGTKPLVTTDTETEHLGTISPTRIHPLKCVYALKYDKTY